MENQGERTARLKLEWQRNHRKEFKKKHGYGEHSHYGAGQMRLLVLQRDSFKCVQCGMTDDEHKERWGRPITIDHKDKNRKNNSLDNLQTLCLSCHGRKDLLPRLRQRQAEKFKSQMIQLRKEGKTYQEIADTFSFSIATAFKWIKRWEEEN